MLFFLRTASEICHKAVNPFQNTSPKKKKKNKTRNKLIMYKANAGKALKFLTWCLLALVFMAGGVSEAAAADERS